MSASEIPLPPPAANEAVEPPSPTEAPPSESPPASMAAQALLAAESPPEEPSAREPKPPRAGAQLARPLPGGAARAETAFSGLRRLVMDTSVFTNPEIREPFGTTATEALASFIRLARRVPDLEFYMPPSIWAELGNFVEPELVPDEAELVIQRKPANKLALSVPAFLIFELIEDLRRRIDKGLRVAEEAARAAPGGSISEQERLSTLRRKYREALREGIIDSTEDVELILLARELDAIVVSADRGIVTWAEKLGLRWMNPRALHGVLLALAK